MSGASLGLRTGSYGSLLLQQQQQQQTRKAAKMVPKERFLASIYRIAGRRKVGMLLLAIISVVVFVSILSASKEDASEGPGLSWGSYSQRRVGTRKTVISQPRLLPEKYGQNVTKPKILPPVQEKLQPLIINKSVLSSRHPCETVIVPPPPPDSKRIGPRPCEVCYAPVEYALALMPSSPSPSPILKNLTYFSEENSSMNVSNGGSDFGGHPSLQQRYESFNIKESMTVNCGFYSGTRPGIGSGFDIDELDLLEMEKCHGLVVASAIFGNYDLIQQPKNISEITKMHACFFMFLDEETEAYVKNSSVLDDKKRVGLWRVVVVHNLPYVDARRNGKVPKLLLHRLFPNARFSLWIDGKLELVVDPFQVLERFLWRRNATFAISRHYRRFDVFEEAEANKAAGKYDNASIDFQVDFYKAEGLTHYSAAKLPITSDVPEGCVIIKEHIPITNLFTCLWFNEVDRFTSRDQLSFSMVRDRVISQVNWGMEMFWDCERRNFVVQAYHKDLLDYMKQHPVQPPPKSPARSETVRKTIPLPVRTETARKTTPLPVRTETAKKPLPVPEPVVDADALKKPSGKRGRDKRSSSRRRRPRVGNSRDISSV